MESHEGADWRVKITLVKPNIGRMEHSLYVDEGRMEPLQLGVLAGLTPEDVEVVLYDDRLEEIPYDEATDLVAITVEIYTARRAYEISSEYRQRGIPVVMGGFHATLAPEEVALYCDALLTGDAETLWPQMVRDAQEGKLEKIYAAPVGAAQEVGERRFLPRRDLFRGKGYLPITLMQYSRGCRFSCEFCAISQFFDRKHFVRHTAAVIREIEAQERDFLFFVDDNLLVNPEAAKLFLRELIPLRIKWVSQASIEMTEDPELMQLLVDSGCIGNVIGFESLDARNVKSMRKAPNLMGKRKTGWDGYAAQCEILRDHGLQTWAAFTLGHDHDTVESIKATLDFAMAQKFCFAAYNILMPYPRTPFFHRLESENRLLWDGQWWLHPEYRFNHAAFVPSNMTPEELTEACWHCRDQWNRPLSIFRRMWDFKTHLSSLTRLAIYLTYNPLYGKEAYKKQGMYFGLHRDTVNTQGTGRVQEVFRGAA